MIVVFSSKSYFARTLFTTMFPLLNFQHKVEYKCLSMTMQKCFERVHYSGGNSRATLPRLNERYRVRNDHVCSRDERETRA